MKPVIDILEERVSAVMAAVAGVEDCAAIVRPAADPKFGDYQVNGVMPLDSVDYEGGDSDGGSDPDEF